MPDGEAVAHLPLDLTNVELIDARACGTSPHELDHLGKVVRWPFKVRLDGAIGAIAYPAAHLEPVRLLASPCAEEDALHAPRDPDMARNAGHQTVEISGASSAFMPTTL